MNFYKNMRIAGSVVMIAGALMRNLGLSLVGFVIQYMGLYLSVNNLEDLEEKKEEKL